MSKMLIIEHPCRLCKVNMRIPVDTDDLKAFQELMGHPPDTFLEMTVCNRCHDYHVGKKSILYKVDLIRLRCERTKKVNQEDTELLKVLARSFCTVISTYHGLRMPYDEQERWIADVASQPHNAWQSLVEFSRQAPHLKRQQQQQLTKQPHND